MRITIKEFWLELKEGFREDIHVRISVISLIGSIVTLGISVLSLLIKQQLLGQ